MNSAQEGGLTVSEDFETVLASARAGEPWAARRLYEDLAPAVTGYLHWLGTSDPDDVASEVFLGVFRNLGRFTGDRESFRSWVFTIAHRRYVDAQRELGRRPETLTLRAEEDWVGGDTEEEALLLLQGGWVARVLGELTPEQREVILLRVVGDLSVDQVAGIVGKRPGAIRALQHRGLAKLRESMAHEQRVATA